MQQKILYKLEFDKILIQLAHYTSSDVGKKKALELVPYHDRELVIHALAQTKDAVELLRLKGGIPPIGLKDVSQHIKRLEIAAQLNGKEIADILKGLIVTRDVVRFFKDAQEDVVLDVLPQLISRLVELPEVLKLLQMTISLDGQVLDDASPVLKGIRHSMKRAEQAVREKLESILRKNQSQLSDAIITMRNDRYVIPVKQEYRNQFGGMIHDQSGSGQTVFIEPQDVLELNNKLRRLQVEEKQEIDRILWELSEKITPYASDIYVNHMILGELDFIHAKCLLAKEQRAYCPTVDVSNEIALYGARHPLIDPNLVVKNDLLLGGDYQSIVITGPNTGGKTILLKTFGLLQLMAQSGLHIPVDEGSQIGVFKHIFADIGDEQSIEQNLSTFSSHMTNIIDILQRIDNETLVLFDELGSGTDPQEGASLAMSILDYIGVKGSYVIATTHYPELKMYGYNRVGTVNASMEFDSDTLAPTYKFLMGIPGKSNAFDISKRLGLDETIIQQARLFMNQDSQQLNDMITALEDMRQQLEKEKEQVKRDMAQAEALLHDVTVGKAYLDEQRDALIEQAKAQANALIEEAQTETDKILSDVRQMQMKQGQAIVKEHEMIATKTALANLKHEETLKKNRVLQKAKRQKQLQVGDAVEVMSYGQRGVIEQKVSETQFVVKMGILKMKVDISDLRLIDAENPKQKKYIPTLKGGRTRSVTSQLDLRGKRYEEAIVELDRYLDAALLANYPQVTIVHGRGTGAIREGVVQYLKKHKGVQSFEFAPINQGGNGATIVKFKG